MATLFKKRELVVFNPDADDEDQIQRSEDIPTRPTDTYPTGYNDQYGPLYHPPAPPPRSSQSAGLVPTSSYSNPPAVASEESDQATSPGVSWNPKPRYLNGSSSTSPSNNGGAQFPNHQSPLVCPPSLTSPSDPNPSGVGAHTPPTVCARLDGTEYQTIYLGPNIQGGLGIRNRIYSELKLSDYPRYRLYREENDKLSVALDDDDLWHIFSSNQVKCIKLLARAHGQLPPPPNYAPPPVPSALPSSSGPQIIDNGSSIFREKGGRRWANRGNEPSSMSPRTSDNTRVTNSPYVYERQQNGTRVVRQPPASRSDVSIHYVQHNRSNSTSENQVVDVSDAAGRSFSPSTPSTQFYQNPTDSTSHLARVSPSSFTPPPPPVPPSSIPLSVPPPPSLPPLATQQVVSKSFQERGPISPDPNPRFTSNRPNATDIDFTNQNRIGIPYVKRPIATPIDTSMGSYLNSRPNSNRGQGGALSPRGTGSSTLRPNTTDAAVSPSTAYPRESGQTTRPQTSTTPSYNHPLVLTPRQPSYPTTNPQNRVGTLSHLFNSTVLDQPGPTRTPLKASHKPISKVKSELGLRRPPAESSSLPSGTNLRPAPNPNHYEVATRKIVMGRTDPPPLPLPSSYVGRSADERRISPSEPNRPSQLQPSKNRFRANHSSPLSPQDEGTIVGILPATSIRSPITPRESRGESRPNMRKFGSKSSRESLPRDEDDNDSSESDDSSRIRGLYVVPPADDNSPSRQPSISVDTTIAYNRNSGSPVISPHERTLRPNRPQEPSFSETDEPWDRIRPAIDHVYDKLDKYFPGHDLDKPMIDASFGTPSPTTAEPVPINEVERAARKQKKKSIRVLAREKQNILKRQSMMESPSTAKLRRRSTRMWDSKVEEVQANDVLDSPPVPPLPATKVTNTFQWLKGGIIGRGSYGKVYLAMVVTTGEMIAVKQVELPSTASDHQDQRQRIVIEALRSESATLKDLDHPNIVQYLGIEQTPEHLSIFMEYVSGGSIGACLRKQGKLGASVVKSFTGQILAGLEYLHSKDILHRDLKADNILVDPQGICKISDFGISKRATTGDVYEADESATQMAGTIYWMAPEVVDSRGGYSAKVDIWSLGCVWQEMCTGERPWKDQNMFYVLSRLGRERQPPPLPEEVVLPPDAMTFRASCFAIDPRERPDAGGLRPHPYLILPPDWKFVGLTD